MVIGEQFCYILKATEKSRKTFQKIKDNYNKLLFECDFVPCKLSNDRKFCLTMVMRDIFNSALEEILHFSMSDFSNAIYVTQKLGIDS
jgi:hypothetical protein